MGAKEYIGEFRRAANHERNKAFFLISLGIKSDDETMRKDLAKWDAMDKDKEYISKIVKIHFDAYKEDLAKCVADCDDVIEKYTTQYEVTIRGGQPDSEGNIVEDVDFRKTSTPKIEVGIYYFQIRDVVRNMRDFWLNFLGEYSQPHSVAPKKENVAIDKEFGSYFSAIFHGVGNNIPYYKWLVDRMIEDKYTGKEVAQIALLCYEGGYMVNKPNTFAAWHKIFCEKCGCQYVKYANKNKLRAEMSEEFKSYWNFLKQ
ncbi:MAG: hypothetical protein RR256_06915 [Bacteroidales bacterium]